MVELDEFGGSEDGGLAILGTDGETVHVTPPRVAASLRYLLARRHSLGGHQLPGRIAVTAALHGEGVTYVTRSLGSLLAYDTESSVAIVDLNWRLPKPERVDTKKSARPTEPEAPRFPTLVDAVEHDTDPADIIQATTNPRLSLVTAGELPLARRPAVAGSRALEQVIEDVASRFDHVLLDLPPVLASSDSIKLAQLGDAYVLVVLQGVTAERQIEAALHELDGNESLGVILNRFDSKVPKALRRLVEA